MFPLAACLLQEGGSGLQEADVHSVLAGIIADVSSSSPAQGSPEAALSGSLSTSQTVSSMVSVLQLLVLKKCDHTLFVKPLHVHDNLTESG